MNSTNLSFSFDQEEPEQQFSTNVVNNSGKTTGESVIVDDNNNNNNNNTRFVSNMDVDQTPQPFVVPNDPGRDDSHQTSSNKRKFDEVEKSLNDSSEADNFMDDTGDIDPDEVREMLGDVDNTNDQGYFSNPFEEAFDLNDPYVEYQHDEYSKDVAKKLLAATTLDGSVRASTTNISIETYGNTYGWDTPITKWRLIELTAMLKLFQIISSKTGMGIPSANELKKALQDYPNALRDADYIATRASKVRINSILLFNPFSALLSLEQMEDVVDVDEKGLLYKGRKDDYIITFDVLEKLFYSVHVQEELFGNQKIDITGLCQFFSKNLTLQRNLFHDSLMVFRLSYVHFLIFRLTEFLNVKQTFVKDEVRQDKQVSTFGPTIRLIGEAKEVMTHDMKENSFGHLLRNEQLTPDVIFGKIFQVLTSKLQDIEIEGALGNFGKDAS